MKCTHGRHKRKSVILTFCPPGNTLNIVENSQRKEKISMQIKGFEQEKF